MRRRLVFAGVAATALAPLRRATAQARPWRIGQVGFLAADNPVFDGLHKRLEALGSAKGRTVHLEYVSVKDPSEPGAAFAGLVERGADILLAGGAEPILRAARDAAAGKLPVVFIAIDYDPFARGFVSSLARPGGNLTGIFIRQVELAQKRIELAHELLPEARRLALWWDFASRDQATAAAETARTLGLEPREIEAADPADYRSALAASAGADGLVLPASPLFFTHGAEIAALAHAHRLPLIAPFREFAAVGALMTYGVDLGTAFADCAAYIDRIIRGAKPADLPIEQPTHFPRSTAGLPLSSASSFHRRCRPAPTR